MTDPLVTKLERRDTLSSEEKVVLGRVLDPPRRVPAGVDIVAEHTRPDHSLLLIEGFCARYTTLSDGARQITQIGVPGDFVDLHSLVMKQMDHGVVTLTDVVIRQAPHTALLGLTETHAHLTRLLWLDTVVDGAIHRQWLVAMGRRSALAQMAHLLCELYLRLEAVEEAADGRMRLPLTQSVLADMLGLSTVHINRVVTELKETGLIQWAAGWVEIVDPDRLWALAEFNPIYLRLRYDPV